MALHKSIGLQLSFSLKKKSIGRIFDLFFGKIKHTEEMHYLSFLPKVLWLDDVVTKFGYLHKCHSAALESKLFFFCLIMEEKSEK